MPFPVTLITTLSRSSGGGTLQRALDAASRVRGILETPESFAFSLHDVADESMLLETVSAMLRTPVDQRLVAISDKFVASGLTEPSILARQIRDLVNPTTHLCGLVALAPGAPRRLPDIDYVVRAAPVEPGVLADAMVRTATGLWLKSAPTIPTTIDEGTAIRTQLVASERQLRECLQLRYDVYNAMGYLEEAIACSESRIELDWFDLYSLHFAAFEHDTGRLAGTLRLVVPQMPVLLSDSVVGQPVITHERQQSWLMAIARRERDPVFRKKLNNGYLFPLPILQSTDFQEKWSEHLQDARVSGEISRVVVSPRYRGAGISRVLIRAAIATACDLALRYLLLECAPVHQTMYAKYGFERLEGYHTRTTELDQVAVGMRLELTDDPTNRAVALARRDLQMIRGGTPRSGSLSESAHLCLCHNTRCWADGLYDFREHTDCPLNAEHRG